MTSSRFGRGRVYVLMFSLMLVNNIDRSAIAIVARDIATEFKLSSVDMGFFFSTFLWTYAACLIPVGILLDRFGPGRVNSIGVTIWSLAIAATACAGNFAALVAARLVMGGAEATTIPSSARIVRLWMPAKERAFASSIYGAGGFFGPAVGAVLVAWLATHWGWRTSFVVLALLGFVWLLGNFAWYGRPEDVKWLSSEERERILAERGAGETAPAKSGGTSGALLELFRSSSMWGVMAAQAAAAYNLYLLMFWLPSYLQDSKHLTIMKTGLYSAIPWAVAVPLSILIAMVSDRLLTKHGLACGHRRFGVMLTLMLASVILLAPLIDNTAMLLALFAIALSGTAASLALINSLATDLVSDARDFGKAISIIVTSGNVCGLMSPIVTGYLISVTGSYDWAFAIAALLLLLGAIAVVFLTRWPILTAAAPSPTFDPAAAVMAE